MIFAVRDRLRGEERHLASTRQRLVIQSGHLLAVGDADAREHIASCSPPTIPRGDSRRAGPSSRTSNGAVVKSLADIAAGRRRARARERRNI